MKGRPAVCHRPVSTRWQVPAGSLAATGVMTTTFITPSDTSRAAGQKSALTAAAARIVEHNEVKTAA